MMPAWCARSGGRWPEGVAPLLAFPARRWEPADVDGNPEHLVCGLAASLSGGAWRPDQFTRFLAWFGGGHDGEPVQLLCDHERWQVTPHGRESRAVGECLAFASVPAVGEVPGGLLVLAGLYPERAGQILADMRHRGRWLAMSVRGAEHGIPGRPGDLWVCECSLVSRAGEQLDPSALVLAHGREAASVWELLTGSPPARA
jgi:hypothetical protein